jgi:hypothetical protein
MTKKAYRIRNWSAEPNLFFLLSITQQYNEIRLRKILHLFHVMNSSHDLNRHLIKKKNYAFGNRKIIIIDVL